jgi:hypothetical protein
VGPESLIFSAISRAIRSGSGVTFRTWLQVNDSIGGRGYHLCKLPSKQAPNEEGYTHNVDMGHSQKCTSSPLFQQSAKKKNAGYDVPLKHNQ